MQVRSHLRRQAEAGLDAFQVCDCASAGECTYVHCVCLLACLLVCLFVCLFVCMFFCLVLSCCLRATRVRQSTNALPYLSPWQLVDDDEDGFVSRVQADRALRCVGVFVYTCLPAWLCVCSSVYCKLYHGCECMPVSTCIYIRMYLCVCVCVCVLQPHWSAPDIRAARCSVLTHNPLEVLEPVQASQ